MPDKGHFLITSQFKAGWRRLSSVHHWGTKHDLSGGSAMAWGLGGLPCIICPWAAGQRRARVQGIPRTFHGRRLDVVEHVTSATFSDRSLVTWSRRSVCRRNLANKVYLGAQEEKKAELNEHLTCLWGRCLCLQRVPKEVSQQRSGFALMFF